MASLVRTFARFSIGAAVVAAACDTTTAISPRVGTITVDNPPAALPVGETTRLSATVHGADGKVLTGYPVYWGAMDTTILRVDSLTGSIHARVPGTTRVVASSQDQYGSADVTVPEGPRIPFDSVVADALSIDDDADEFTFSANKGQQLNVFLRGTSGVATHRFRLRLLGPGRNVIDSVVSHGNDAVLRRQAIGWVTLAEGGLYRLRVDGNVGSDRAPYELMVQRVNPAPESAPSAIKLGTLVTGESLTPGDVDTFTFSGTAGQEISILFAAHSGSGNDALRLTVLTPASSELVFVQSNGDYRAAQPSGRDTLPQTGTYTVRVRGIDQEDQGPYDFVVYSISRAPEHVAAAVSANAIVSGEDLSPVGDVDEFTYAAAAPQEVNVYFRAVKGVASDSLVMRVLDPAGKELGNVALLGTDTLLYAHAVGHLPLAKATYGIRVEGGRATRSAYAFQLRTINLAPEVASSTVTYGTYLNDAISPVGDVDQYFLQANAGDSVRIGLQALSGSAADVLQLYLYLPTGVQQRALQANGSQLEQTTALRLPQSGSYRIRIQGVNSTDDGGSYRFRVIDLK